MAKYSRVYYYFCIIVSCSISLTLQRDDYQQNAFSATMERYEITSKNDLYIGHAKVKTAKFNRTTTVINFELEPLILIESAVLYYKVYKYVGMDYKFMGVQSSVDICKSIKHNYYGLAMAKTAGNFTDCPMQPGVYVLEKFTLNSEKLPPLAPEGTFKMELKMVANKIKEPVYYGYFLLKIEYPVVKKKSQRT